MGAGTSIPGKEGGSSVSSQLRKARDSDAYAAEIFDNLDDNNDKTLSVVELYDAATKYGEAVNGHWQLEKIKETIEKFDSDGDGKLDLEEFKTALSQLEDKKPTFSKKASSRGSGKLKSKLKRAFTWKKSDLSALAAAAVEAAEAEAAAEEEAAAAAAAVAAVDQDALLTPEERQLKQKAAYWERQESMVCWQVPLGLNRDQMPWLVDGETGLSVAIERARGMGKTPLLVDSSHQQVVQSWLADKGEGSVFELEAYKMFVDERNGVRNHAQVMGDARALLVQAMRSGGTFHIKLGDKVTEFTGGMYTDQTNLPIGVFNHELVSEALAKYAADAAPPAGVDAGSWHGLWGQGETNALAKVLVEADLSPDGAFFVGKGFNVVVSTQKKVGEFMGDLRVSLPMPKLQGINPIDKPIWKVGDGLKQ